MKPESAAERRRFLADLDRMVEDLAQPFGTTQRNRPRARDWMTTGLRWRLWAEAEPPGYPRTFRLTWGVMTASSPPAGECMWAEDVEQLRHASTRIYRYRLGEPPDLLRRLREALGGPDLTLPAERMTAYLRDLVQETLLPLVHEHGTPDGLADWVSDNYRQVGRYGDRGREAILPVADRLRRG